MFPPARIAVSVRSGEICSRTVRQAVQLARHFNAEVVLFHAWKQTPRLSPDQLRQVVPDEPGIPVTDAIVEGEIVPAILQLARDRKADLLVMSRGRCGALRAFLRGSKVEGVLHEAPCPVWVGGQGETLPRITTVLCAVDLGPDSRAAVQWGCLLSEHFGAELALAHVPPKVESVVGVYALDPDIQTQYEDAVRDELLQLGPVPASAGCHILRGEPVSQICSLAERIRAGLLVIGGAGGSGRAARFRMHAHGIARRSPCAVVSVRAAAA